MAINHFEYCDFAMEECHRIQMAELGELVSRPERDGDPFPKVQTTKEPPAKEQALPKSSQSPGVFRGNLLARPLFTDPR